jgi:predicted dehydrogenase
MANTAARVAWVCDISPARLDKLRFVYPTIRTTTAALELIADPEIDAVIVATPVLTHFELVSAALQAGKHVLVEKPMATTSKQAEQLIELAERKHLVLMVDHTFLYTGAVRKMKELIRSSAFGEVHYYDSTRINLGIFQHDVNVLWDLAVHDLSIMSYVLTPPVQAVSATGQKYGQSQNEYIAFLTLYCGEIIAHINVNWLSPVKIRRTVVGGSRQMLVYDDLETSEKVKLYDKGIVVTETPEDVHRLLISYRTGDLWSPKVDEAEALSVEADHFVACIRGEAKPITSGLEGLKIVRILEAADESLRKFGTLVRVTN